jgi:hypothetical protein
MANGLMRAKWAWQQEEYRRRTVQRTTQQPVITGHGHTKAGQPVYTLSSRSNPDIWRIVIVYRDHLSCTCPAGAHGRMCAHKRIVQARLDAQNAAKVRAMWEDNAEASAVFDDDELGIPRYENAIMQRDPRPFSIFKTGAPR